MAANISTDEYKFHYHKAKRYFKKGDIENSIKELKIAFKINPNEELQSKINKLEALTNKNQTELLEFKPNKNKVLINETYYLNAKMFDKLYEYQQEGVIWLFELFKQKKGCILADDMGLGKTIQMIFYLRELFESEMIKSVLIIIPKSLIVNWERELIVWAPDLLVLTYFGNDKENKWKCLKKIQHKGGILITTYGTVMHSWDGLNSDENFKWNILLLDEGHKIKNPSSKTFKTVNALRADLRIVMTGTAVQNNLKELWALFDFTHQGSLLGTYPTFNRGYERPITDSRKKDASKEEKLYGDRISISLKNLIKPYFLRRTKEQVINQINVNSGGLSIKTDLAIWIPMTDVQIDFYKRFLELEEVKILLLRTEKRSPLLELNVLKKICDHPRLLSPEQCQTLGLKYARTINDIDIDDLIAESGKMTFVIQLLKQMIIENCKCLIFSQSKVILNILGRLLLSMKVKFLRLDGDVLKATDRQMIVDNFNTNSEVKILLLTLQVGGVGLTLTGANRVIIYDLNWNPSIDAQAVDRIYRIGQKKDVIVYRLISCGTVEEKIYRRQIFKDSLNRQTTGIQKADDNTCRYFTQNELFELFTMGNPQVSETQIHLNEKHSREPINEYLAEHCHWLNEQKIFGISYHDLLFSEGDEKINIDKETEMIISANMRQTESILNKEAQSQLNDEEQNLRFLMSRLAINEKAKVKEKYQNSELFIPNKNDIKRPVFNQPNKTIFQTKLDDYLVTGNQQDDATEDVIDLTRDDDNKTDGKIGNELLVSNTTITNNNWNSEGKEHNYRDNESEVERATNRGNFFLNNASSLTKFEISQSNDNRSKFESKICRTDSESNSDDLDQGKVERNFGKGISDSSDEVIDRGTTGNDPRSIIEIDTSSGTESDLSQSDNDSYENDYVSNVDDLKSEIKKEGAAQAPIMKISDSSEEDGDGTNGKDSEDEYGDSSSTVEGSGTESVSSQSDEDSVNNTDDFKSEMTNEKARRMKISDSSEEDSNDHEEIERKNNGRDSIIIMEDSSIERSSKEPGFSQSKVAIDEINANENSLDLESNKSFDESQDLLDETI